MKKMRKLIPAIALLLVSAVMLSTATFAWFTMNEQVTATGMQVQAKAAGNLLISETKMDAGDQGLTVKLTAPETLEVSPITYTPAKDAGEGQTAIPAAWQIPKDYNAIDPTYGTLKDGNDLENVKFTSGIDFKDSKYFVDYVVYIATAGDASEMLGKKLYAKMEITSAAIDIAGAYSVAFYVDKSGNYTGENTDGFTTDEFVGCANYKQFAEDANFVLEFDGTFNIPSTYGATSTSKQGLAILMRVYVDGALQKGTDTPNVPVIKAGKDLADWKDEYRNYTWYKDVVGTQLISSGIFGSKEDVADYFYWDNQTTEAGKETYPVYYVNNKSIPTDATSFTITIGAEDAPVVEEPEAEPGDQT